MNRYIFLLFIGLVFNASVAQLPPSPFHCDTIEGHFDKRYKSNEGYLFNNMLFDIPRGIADKCQKKTIRVLGYVTSHFDKADYLRLDDNKSIDKYILGPEGAYVTYEVHSIYVFSAKKKTWALIYNQQEDN